jgi:arsenite-transporting ATPase
MKKKVKNLFFLGKGGTGKTTIAACTSLALAEKGNRIALISLDPAHNLFDIFEINSSHRTKKMNNYLTVEEIEVDKWMKSYLKSIEGKIARSYQYLTALNLEKHLETIRYSPGLEEYALQYAFESITKMYDECDYLLFDMPPTALSIRFFNLSNITVIWLEQLIELRKKILEKKKIIDNVHDKDTKRSGDKVLDQLNALKKVNQNIISDFKDKSSSGIFIVLNEDQLSISESKNLYHTISKNDYHVEGILINKYEERLNPIDLQSWFPRIPYHNLPYSNNALIGEKNIKLFYKNEAFIPFLESIEISASK